MIGRRAGVPALFLVLFLGLTACGGAGETEGTATTEEAAGTAETAPPTGTTDTEGAPTPGGGTSAETDATDAAGDLGEPETTSFSFATGGVGFSWVGILTAIDNLRSEGWEIETPELAASELQVEGVARGEFQMSTGATNAVAVAVEQGSPVHMFVSRVRNEWTLYAASDYPTCESLGGARLAIHSEGSPATFMTRNWIEETCPGTQPSYIILPGSENRYAALLAGEIDASPIELSDAIKLEAEGGDAYTRLTSFAETLPELEPTNIYGNPEWMAQNPNTVAIFTAELLSEHRKFNEDPGYLREKVLEHLPQTDEENLDAVVEAYVEADMFPVDGGMSPESQEYTINFFAEAGLIGDQVTPSDAYDRTYLERALEALPAG